MSKQVYFDMVIKGKIHCFFEQSGTFKNEFKKLGYEAMDYDIQDNFGETDNVIDLFGEIEKGYEGKPSIFDNITSDDLIMAFFPCIYFCEKSSVAMRMDCVNYRALSTLGKIEKIIERAENRQKFYVLLIKLFGIVVKRNLKMVFENPYSPMHYLINNFLFNPTMVDKNRRQRGDYFTKPTSYWFVGFKPTNGCTMQTPKKKLVIENCRGGKKAGICSEERSMISPDYARNFICDFILGKEQINSQLNLFE